MDKARQCDTLDGRQYGTQDGRQRGTQDGRQCGMQDGIHERTRRVARLQNSPLLPRSQRLPSRRDGRIRYLHSHHATLPTEPSHRTYSFRQGQTDALKAGCSPDSARFAWH